MHLINMDQAIIKSTSVLYLTFQNFQNTALPEVQYSYPHINLCISSSVYNLIINLNLSMGHGMIINK